MDRRSPDEAGAAVLAGGAGRRLGGDKARTHLAGKMLVEYPVNALREAGLDPVIITKPDLPVDLPETKTVLEPAEPRHPLLGVVTALTAMPGRPVLVLACDLPFIPAGLLQWLAEHPGEVVVPTVTGRLQPLAARYGPASLERLEAGLSSGRSMTSTIMDLDPVLVDEGELARFGDPGRIFFNVNSNSDLETAEEILTGS